MKYPDFFSLSRQRPRRSVVLSIFTAVFLSSRTTGPPAQPTAPLFPLVQEDAGEVGAFRLVDDSGVWFRKANLPDFYHTEYAALGGGVAVADYNSDGRLDLYFVQGGPNVLFRNDGGWRFSDATAAAGIGDAGEGRAAAWGDYNNDGCPDLYVANDFGPNMFYRNLGNGRFEDATDGPAQATGATG